MARLKYKSSDGTWKYISTGGSNSGGGQGVNGTTFTPSVSSEGILSWTNNGGLENPESVNIKGPKGDKGEQGIQGIQGIQGVQGVQGEKGEQGPKGDTGADGAKGDKGDKGDTGEQGIQGPKGEQGIQGVQGEQGPKGDKGDKGDTGATGPQGPAGPQLPQITFTSNIIQLEPNKLYKGGVFSSLTITLAPPTDSSIINEYFIEFMSGSIATTLSLPSSIKWVGGNVPEIEANTTYQISIVNNLGVVGSFK